MGRRTRWTALVALLPCLLACQPAPAPPPDLFSVDQVALRYRALGAHLVDGALRCGPLTGPAPTGPAPAERVHCDFGSWSLELASYDTPELLRSARADALRPAPDSVRSATTTTAAAAFAMDQTLTGTSRLHWDTEQPRPVSATATTTRPLAEHLAVYDSRGFGGLDRPEQPGPAFTSPALWAFAAPLVTGAGGDCRPNTGGPEHYDAVSEQVDCDFPGRVPASFALAPDDAAFDHHRDQELATDDVVPGTHRVAGWHPEGVVVEFVFRGRNWPYLYYDRRDLRCFALVWDDALTPDQLHRLWAEHRG